MRPWDGSSLGDGYQMRHAPLLALRCFRSLAAPKHLEYTHILNKWLTCIVFVPMLLPTYKTLHHRTRAMAKNLRLTPPCAVGAETAGTCPGVARRTCRTYRELGLVGERAIRSATTFVHYLFHLPDLGTGPWCQILAQHGPVAASAGLTGFWFSPSRMAMDYASCPDDTRCRLVVASVGPMKFELRQRDLPALA